MLALRNDAAFSPCLDLRVWVGFRMNVALSSAECVGIDSASPWRSPCSILLPSMGKIQWDQAWVLASWAFLLLKHLCVLWWTSCKECGKGEESKCCCPVFRTVQPVSFGVQSGMAHLTFGGHVVPRLALEGCKTNSFMKGAVLQLESGYLCTVIPAVGSLWDEKTGMETRKHQ